MLLTFVLGAGNLLLENLTPLGPFSLRCVTLYHFLFVLERDQFAEKSFLFGYYFTLLPFIVFAGKIRSHGLIPLFIIKEISLLKQDRFMLDLMIINYFLDVFNEYKFPSWFDHKQFGIFLYTVYVMFIGNGESYELGFPFYVPVLLLHFDKTPIDDNGDSFESFVFQSGTKILSYWQNNEGHIWDQFSKYGTFKFMKRETTPIHTPNPDYSEFNNANFNEVPFTKPVKLSRTVSIHHTEDYVNKANFSEVVMTAQNTIEQNIIENKQSITEENPVPENNKDDEDELIPDCDQKTTSNFKKIKKGLKIIANVSDD